MAMEKWGNGEAYERFVGRWSRPVADRFIDWLAVAPAARWVDVGCGTGALSERILRRAAPGSLIGVDPSAGFVAVAADRLAGPDARFEVGRADAIPVADDDADAVVSGLVLTFLPDIPAALAEARRVARSGGLVAAYVWDYAGRMELMRRFWDVAVELDPHGIEHDEGRRFPIATPDRLAEAWVSAGIGDVETTAIEVPTRFVDFEDYWAPFTRDVGAAPLYASRLPTELRDRIRDRLRCTLPINPDGSINLVARAFAVRGRP